MQNKPKILWLINSHLAYVAKELNVNANSTSGWLEGAFCKIKDEKDIALSVCFPFQTSQKYLTINKNNINFYAFKNIGTYTSNLSDAIFMFKEILDKEKPDVVHIFGTEYAHTLAMVKAFDKPDKTVISIQGLCSVYATHYFQGLPQKIINKRTLPEMIRGRGLRYDKEMFVKRGALEIEAIESVDNIIGRTSWDYACSRFINPNTKYYKCNESLRESFYSHVWDYEKCEKHSIFLSQGDYPIKGLHHMLEALAIIKRFYADVKVYVAGGAHSQPKTFMQKLKHKSYPKYIRSLIEKYDLNDNVVFTGFLDEKTMCDRFLSSHVFVSASNIENSPNSVGEAMILGVPCVSSDVGGVCDLMEHKKEGFVYQSTAPYMLANYVIKLFENKQACAEFSKASRKRALLTHDINNNNQALIYAYKSIMGESEGDS